MVQMMRMTTVYLLVTRTSWIRIKMEKASIKFIACITSPKKSQQAKGKTLVFAKELYIVKLESNFDTN